MIQAMRWFCFGALWITCTLVGALETGSEVGAAFLGVDQASSVLFAASVQDQNTRFQAPWHLDRIDQRVLPLDGQFQTQVHSLPKDAGRPQHQAPQLSSSLRTVLKAFSAE